MTSMRAKMKVGHVFVTAPGYENLTLFCVAKSGAYPDDGSDEDNTFAKFSPSGRLELTIANPALLGKFAVGDTFYVDFTPVAQAAAPAPTPAPATAPPPSPDAPPVFTEQPSAPAPAPAPAAPLPAGVLEFYPGSTEIVKLDKIEQFRAAHADDPIISKTAEWFFINGLPSNGFEANANLREGFRSLEGDTGVRNPKRYDASHLIQGFHAVPNNDAAGNPIGFGYMVGDQYPDVMAFIGDDIGQNGAVLYRGVHIEDLDTLLANCLHDLNAARARGEEEIQLIGYFPIIDHSRQGPVAIA